MIKIVFVYFLIFCAYLILYFFRPPLLFFLFSICFFFLLSLSNYLFLRILILFDFCLTVHHQLGKVI